MQKTNTDTQRDFMLAHCLWHCHYIVSAAIGIGLGHLGQHIVVAGYVLEISVIQQTRGINPEPLHVKA